MWVAFALDTHWVAHGTTSPKHVVPNPKKSYMLGSMAFIYVTLAHMIVGNTLNQYISIHMWALLSSGPQTP
jgi:hypothetical protein